MKLHLGCGSNIKDGYVNVDAFVEGEKIENFSIFDLPYGDGEVEEVLAEHLAEHIPFKDEERFWTEVFRVLKKGGRLVVEVPDFEWLCSQFLAGQEGFCEFYKVGHNDHYFGNGRSIEHRWGMITTHFFGNQNGEGQFHYNGYSKGKLISISEMFNCESCDVTKVFSKGAQALVAVMIK